MKLTYKSKIIVLFLFFSQLSFASWPEYFNSTAKRKDSQAERVVRVLKLKRGSAVADLGAGGGYFSVLMARAVGKKGVVYAVEISRESIRYIKKYAMKMGVKNVKTILARENDSKLKSKSVDLVFVRNVFHHISNQVKYFKKLRQVLNPGGKVVIIEYKPHVYPGHSTKESVVYEKMKKAGYKFYKRFIFLKRQNFNIFKVR